MSVQIVLDVFWTASILFGQFGPFLGSLETFYLDSLETARIVWKLSGQSDIFRTVRKLWRKGEKYFGRTLIFTSAGKVGEKLTLHL